MNTEIHAKICELTNEVDLINSQGKEEILFNIIEHKTGFTKQDLQSASKTDDLVFVRFLFCRIARKWMKLKLIEIANLLKRDHSTIIYALTRGQDYINQGYGNFEEKYNECLSLLKLSIYRQK